MNKTSRRIERFTMLALIVTVTAAFYYWDFVHKAFQRSHNTLGQTNVHVPTADLFLWSTASLILYSLSRIWGNIGPKIFELSPERSASVYKRLQIARVLSTFTWLGLTIYTIHTYVPDFIEKLPWP